MRIEIFSLDGELLATVPLDFAPSMIAFDPFGDLWLVDTRESLSARRFEVEWP
jgi:sugar lactone lactonase YvrE